MEYSQSGPFKVTLSASFYLFFSFLVFLPLEVPFNIVTDTSLVDNSHEL